MTIRRPVPAHELGLGVLRAARLSDALSQSEERVTLATEAAGVGLWSWDIPGDRIWGSDRWREMLGFPDDRAVRFDEFTQRVHPGDRDMVDREVWRAVERCGSVALEYRVVLPDGGQRWIAARGRMPAEPTGKPPRMLGAAMDITARKQSELELGQQRDCLAHLSRVSMLGEWSGSLAHELSQPLTAILSNAQAAQRFMSFGEPELTQVSEALADIVAEVTRASKVIERLRPLFRRGEVRCEPLEAGRVILDVLMLARNELLNRGVTAGTELASSLPAISSDPVQLQQVLLNLITNACDAMAGTAPEKRRLLIRAEPEGPGFVRVSVSDCGTGIPPEHLEQVFAPFYTTKAHGMGLGLVVCRTIVAAHGGQIWAVNNPEGGATVHVTLPVAGEKEGVRAVREG